jgi:ATP-dependent Clp protease, protease subunit
MSLTLTGNDYAVESLYGQSSFASVSSAPITSLSSLASLVPYVEPHVVGHVPKVIETSSRGERSFDIFSRLLRERIIILGHVIDDDVANSIVAQLLVLDAENPEKDITMYINSPGGSIYDGLAIYDTMQLIRADVATVCVGEACSMGSIILAGGTAGKRYCLPNSRVMIHQGSGGTRGQAKDIELFAKEMRRLEDMINLLLRQHTGQTIQKLEIDQDRDYYLTAEEAVKYGLADKLVEKVGGL